MLQLENKYKAIPPEETIKHIKNFFQKRNCTIEKQDFISEGNTYSCQLDLYFHKHFILMAQGKGASKIFSDASGYAELYERFCGYQITTSNPINRYFLEQNNKNKQVLSYNELIKEPHTKLFLEHELPVLNEYYLNKYQNIFSIKETYGLKYQNLLNNKDNIYIPPFIGGFMGSAGLAAGNTEEEALVQGCSEIFEKYLTREFYKKEQDCYYYINKETLPDYIKNIVKTIEENDHKVYIYDLSYNFNMPVCMILIINKTNHILYRNFGAFPIIEIAIERCFTEIYQGLKNLRNYNAENAPSNVQTDNLLTQFMVLNNKNKHLIPEKLILNSKQKNIHDSIFYVKDINATNKTLLEHIKKICKITNINLYYNNISLCKEIQAVHIIPDKVLYMDPNENWNWVKKEKTNEEYEKIFNTTMDFFDLFKNIILNNINYNKQLKQILNNINIQNKWDLHNFLSSLWPVLPADIFNPYNCLIIEDPQNWEIFIDKISLIFNYIGNNNYTDFYNTVDPLYLYFQYFKDNKYSHEEILKILSFLKYNNLNISQENFTPEYFIHEILFNFLQKEYNSSEYKEFINLFTKKPEDFE